MWRACLPAGLVVWISACGAAPSVSPAAGPAASVTAPPREERATASPPEPEPRALPTECAGGADAGLCLPPDGFVARLCEDDFPSVALALFRKGTPWTRRYLTRDVEAWNASGGKTASGKMVFDEEVLVLRHRDAGGGGLVINGQSGGGYDVLRWDGSCASLSADELTKRLPPKAKTAKVPWRVLEDHIQAALQRDERIEKRAEERRRECRTASPDKCEKLERKLAAAVVEHVRSGGDVPDPARLP